MKPVEVFIHFDDADPAKIVFFGNYYRLAHRALELSLPQWGLQWDEFFRPTDVGFPVRHSEAEYFKPLRPGKPIFILALPEKVGTSSLTFRYEFRESSDVPGDLLAIVKIVHVCVDSKTIKKTNLPPKMKTALEKAAR
ncbi:acyl-CoA thioesterase [bacterium]|nr:acyl-CoA thioesterase [bacterium]